MKYKKYIWIFFIFALTIGIVYFIQRSHSIEGFMTEDEYITEVFNRIKAIQTIKLSINASLDAFEKSVKDTCDLTPKYRDAYVAARAALPEYKSLTNDERQKNAGADYDEERLTVISSGTPIYECFANPDDVDNATKKLESEMKELSDLLNSRRVRTMIQKGKLLAGLQVMNSTFSGTKLVSEGFINMVREDLLESADFLIKEARKIQTISRLAVTNTSSLSADLVKIPEFVRNRHTGEKNIENSSVLFTQSFKVLVIALDPDGIIRNVQKGLDNYDKDVTVDKLTDINYDDETDTNFKKVNNQIMNPVYKVIIINLVDSYVYRRINNNDWNILKYLESGGNLIVFSLWNKNNMVKSLYPYVSFSEKDTSNNFYSNNKPTIKSVKSHPIINDDINNKSVIIDSNVEKNMNSSLSGAFGIDVKLKDNNDLIVVGDFETTDFDWKFNHKNQPIVAVKTLNNSRIVSVNVLISRAMHFNDVGQKLLARCVLWAAGRI
jgi:hypothetical protein